MTLSDLASIGSFISGASVFVTLVFLLIQMRQTNRNQRSLVQQSRAAMQVDAIIRHAEPQFTEVMARAVDPDAPFSDADVTTVMFISMSYFRGMENSFIQRDAGTIDPVSMESDLASLGAFMTLTVNRISWAILRGAFAGHFREYVDGLVRQTSRLPHATASDWKMLLARELAAS